MHATDNDGSERNPTCLVSVPTCNNETHLVNMPASLLHCEMVTPPTPCFPTAIIPSITKLVVSNVAQPRPAKPFNPRNKELYKTALCNYWVSGVPCRFGERCWFAHGPEELRIAQFVIPAAKPDPFTNSLGFEIRTQAQRCPSNNNISQQMFRTCEHKMSMAIGSERDKARLGRNNVSLDPFTLTMDSASSMRHSSRGAACAPSSDVIKSPGRSDSGFGTSWHSPNSTHSFQELSVNFDETHCKEGNGYNIWGGGAINLNMLPQLSSRDVLEDKENELDWSVCELFALCGECPLEDNCCFIHPKRD